MRLLNSKSILSSLRTRPTSNRSSSFKSKRYSTPTSQLTQTSILPNGIKVATESTPGHFIGVGVYIDAGSRYESNKLRGVTHLTDRMAFKSTKNRTKDQISLEIEELGGSFFASSGRDTIVYQSTSYPNSIDSVLSILSDTSLNPNLLSDELEIEKLSTEWEVNEINKKPEYIIPELLHEIAFPNNTLGLPLICPKDRIHSITTDLLWEYRSMFFKPERIVVAAVGVNHHEFLEYAHKHFGDFKSIDFNPTLSDHSSSFDSNTTTTNPSPIDPLTGKSLETFEELINAKPYYKGGEIRIPDSSSKLAHLYIGFEAPHIHDPDLYAIACAHIMLGGGSSFSAGGPGKGMYSRLYTRVLNPHPEVDFCQAFHHSYSDSGLFGIGMSVLPEFVQNVPNLISTQLNLISKKMEIHHRNGINQNELNRAKNQLRSTMMYGLESRILQVEDLGRQIQSLGKKRAWNEIWESIEALTIEDIHRSISKIIRPELGGFSGEPTIVATGQIEKLGNVKEILNRSGIGTLKDRSKVWW